MHFFIDCGTQNYRDTIAIRSRCLGGRTQRERETVSRWYRDTRLDVSDVPDVILSHQKWSKAVADTGCQRSWPFLGLFEGLTTVSSGRSEALSLCLSVPSRFAVLSPNPTETMLRHCLQRSGMVGLPSRANSQGLDRSEQGECAREPRTEPRW